MAEYLRKEISLTFWNSSRRRNFDLGLLCIDDDCNLLGLSIPDSTCVEFSYIKATLSRLDALLGTSWDISVRDGVTRFVTVVRLRMRISGSIRVADFDGIIATAVYSPTPYRTILYDHMKTSNI